MKDLESDVLLGRASLAQPTYYTQVSIKKLKEIHTLTHPARAKRRNKANAAEEPEATADDILEKLDAEAKSDPE